MMGVLGLCLTLTLFADELRPLVRKWQALMEANVDAKTSDGCTLRLFCIGFTPKRPSQANKARHARSPRIRQIREKMVDITRECKSPRPCSSSLWRSSCTR